MKETKDVCIFFAVDYNCTWSKWCTNARRHTLLYSLLDAVMRSEMWRCGLSLSMRPCCTASALSTCNQRNCKGYIIIFTQTKNKKNCVAKKKLQTHVGLKQYALLFFFCCAGKNMLMAVNFAHIPRTATEAVVSSEREIKTYIRMHMHLGLM